MNAEEALRQGNLNEAVAQLQARVRAEPANARLRVFLFQLLAVLGQWGRALNQLQVAGELDAGNLAMVNTYREALRCEVLRAEVFAGTRSPLIFGDPEQWLAMLLEALRLTAEGRHPESQALRSGAFELAPASGGSVDGAPFAWLADADARLGPVLEAVVNGRYYWIPLHRLRRIQVEAPVDLRDLVWAPAHLAWANGGDAVALIPTRYPGSESSEDPQVRMARKTDWSEQPSGLYLGLGQRMLASDSGEYPLLEIREVALATDESPDTASARRSSPAQP
jgi:type VI secretion system protein ImpE